MSEQRDYRDTVFLPKTEFPMKAGLPAKEPGILARWQAEDIYQQLRAARAGREKFILHDGPPYANGDMHIGHALNHILKDMVVRTQTLLGKDAPYVPGWDCHGLPIEWKVEEQYRKQKKNKDEVPAEEFRAECRAYAQNWVDVQREQLKRLGIGGDWDNPYLTMDFAAEATIVGELLKFAESGQLYRGAKPVMWSPVEKTALAEAEVEYEDIVSTQIDVAFEIVESPIAELVGAHAVIWTTTPWTIPVNQALAFGPDIDYIVINHGGKRLLIADALLDEVTKRLHGYPNNEDEVIEGPPLAADHPIMQQTMDAIELPRVIKGSELAGTIARHPMANLFRRPVLDTGLGSSSGAAPEGESQGPDQVRADAVGGVNVDYPLAEFFLRPRPFLPGDFVTTDSGTGLVHMAPDHGEDDFLLCKAHGIDPVFAVEADGKYREDWAWLGGQGPVVPYSPKGQDKLNIPEGPICTALDEVGALLSASAYPHSYPHSWRSKAKVIFRCTPQWFVPMDKAHDPSTAATASRGSPPRSGEVLESATQTPPRNGEGDHAEGSGGGVPQDIPLCQHEVDARAENAALAGQTLRQTAMQAIAETRWVPEKGRNRIGAMVEGRPDWVLSRQRAWGVPITLFVQKGTNQYLNDPAVNARIVAAVKTDGVDAWNDARAQEYLGNDYRCEDYERVTDILDVWFDSGSTHAFVLESGKWPDLLRPEGYEGPPADLYLEGSDQHRGWFQSSLLESCATRGHAPYKAVLTHGFTMDAKGMKMSKSLGNTIDPLKVMEINGADIIRLWALTVDYTEDHRIGDEILKGVADQYRKLRNTFRYLLGALDGFSEAERVDVTAMPELERYVLALLARLDGTLRQAVDDFDFNTYVRALTDFCNEDLSAFFFDIRKDCLYCDAADEPKRMAYRTVLDTLFHALVRYAAPVLVFTAEEVWGTRYQDGGTVHLLEWPEVDGSWNDEFLFERWVSIRNLRSSVTEAIEPLRREKTLGSSLEANVEFGVLSAIAPGFSMADLSELLITSDVTKSMDHSTVRATRTTHHKCGRCWRHLPDVPEDGALCSRCDNVVAGMDAMA